MTRASMRTFLLITLSVACPLFGLWGVLPGVVPGVNAQEGSSGAGEAADAKAKAEHLNNGLYKIYIYADAYWGPRDGKLYTATGVLIKKPNIILTTVLRDDDGNNLFSFDTTFSSITFVCEQLPDPVKLASLSRKIEDELKDKDSEVENNKYYGVFSQAARKDDKWKKLEGLSPNQKKKEEKKLNKDVRDRIIKFSSKLAEKEECVEYEIKTYDLDRGLVLLRTKETLNGGVPPFNVTDVEQGTSIKAIGFPIAADRIATRRATADEKRTSRLIPSVTSGSVVKTQVDKKGGQLILHKAPLSAGDWGSPLVNECNQVVGLNRQPETAVKLLTTGGSSEITDKNKGQVTPNTVTVFGSGVVTAVGARELKNYLDLDGISLANIVEKPCEVKAASFAIRDNMWTLLLGGAALLLASTSLVLAVRRPGPVRNTVAKIFPGALRSQKDEIGYGGDGYEGNHRSSSQQLSGPEAYASTSQPISVPSSSAASRPDPTNVIPELAGGGRGNIKLVPVGGGQPIILDTSDLTQDGVVFGRELDKAIGATNKTVSNRHARLSLTSGGKLQVEDLGSANGTWRGRRRIQREVFENSDVVRFGSVEFRVELPSTESDQSGATVFMGHVGSWLLSGFDASGTTIRLQLQPTIDSTGRPVETSWVVGRNPDHAQFVLSDESVSNEHAKVRFTPQRGLEVCDLGSSNGTRVDGAAVLDSYVSIDDAKTLELGNIKLSLTRV